MGLSLKGKAIMAQFIVVAKEAGKGQIDIPDGGEGHYGPSQEGGEGH